MDLDAVSYSFTCTPAGVSGNVVLGYTQAVKGRIIRVSTQANNTAGSLIIQESGTNALVYIDNAASGTNYLHMYPVLVRMNASVTRATLNQSSGNAWSELFVNGPLQIIGSQMTSGAFISGIIMFV